MFVLTIVLWVLAVLTVFYHLAVNDFFLLDGVIEILLNPLFYIFIGGAIWAQRKSRIAPETQADKPPKSVQHERSVEQSVELPEGAFGRGEVREVIKEVPVEIEKIVEVEVFRDVNKTWMNILVAVLVVALFVTGIGWLSSASEEGIQGNLGTQTEQEAQTEAEMFCTGYALGIVNVSLQSSDAFNEEHNRLHERYGDPFPVDNKRPNIPARHLAFETSVVNCMAFYGYELEFSRA
jgi:hypothetical protein